jgi:nicotinate-nucleotide adenylyltransferase
VASVGILGGTFNPPHRGHLGLARTALEQLGLDEVWLMPVALPPHKSPEDDPGFEHRVELARRLADEDPRLRVSRLEVDRGGPSWTVDTLRALRESHPEHELSFILGGDVAASLPAWREPDEVLALARFAVAERSAARRSEIEQALATLGGGRDVVFLDMPPDDASSSEVRRRIAEGIEPGDLVPQSVARYIREHGLYGAGVSAR